ncbi:MAG: hypothetical protein A2Y90_02790 [Chloroflexi bacterium RBG_13_52_12]|nr:MAG: hypothetical protein A2Y90_02790 [Chloroflexi bacterium RBG_13_52_12]
MGKYDKYICTSLQKRDMLPGPNPAERDKLAAAGKRISMEHILWVDNEVIPGAYYGETTFIWPTTYPGQIGWEEQMKLPTNDKPMFPHAHDFPELLSWWGTDPDHPENTGSMGMIMGDEVIPLESSWVAYIPAGMLHMPTRGKGGKTTKLPVCHWTSGPGFYNREKDHAEEGKATKPANPMQPPPITEGERKNDKYLVYGTKPNQSRKYYMLPYDPKYVKPMALVDDTIVPGCEFGCETLWLLPGDKSKAGYNMMKERTVSHGTSIVFNAMNYDDITDLRAEVELWIGGEKHIINKNFGAYIPPDVKAGPMIIRNIQKQVFFMISYPVGLGVTKWRGGK